MKKAGRPKTDNPKKHNITCRLTDSEYGRLKEYTLKHNVTITDVIMNAMEEILKK